MVGKADFWLAKPVLLVSNAGAEGSNRVLGKLIATENESNG